METKRVLLIDDEVGFTDAMKINLEASGRYEVGVVNESTEAFETARKFKPDLIVLDIVMPNKDGGNLMIEFERDPRMSRVPVVMLTALVSNDETSGDPVVQSGGEVMLAKPVTTDKLIGTIEARLSGKL